MKCRFSKIERKIDYINLGKIARRYRRLEMKKEKKGKKREKEKKEGNRRMKMKVKRYMDLSLKFECFH